jgi:oligopeptide/dipeptide ABC transporter ATP-binding protein
MAARRGRTTSQSTRREAVSSVLAASADPVLDIRGLSVTFNARTRPVSAVRSVDLSVRRGETVCVVGETGCGKSSMLNAILRLNADADTVVTAEQSCLDGRDLTTLSKADLRSLRGGKVGVIFQDPMSALNPLLPIGRQMIDVLRAHQTVKQGRAALETRVEELLSQVGISDPRRRRQQYPHEFSGGMLQRVVIAIAVANDPALVLADEPTTALDVTLQAQVLRLLADLQRRTGAGLILVTHDLGVVAEVADTVMVMYAGRVVEKGTLHEVFGRPRHPYTAGLLRSMPSRASRSERLPAIPGYPPSPAEASAGCAFLDRCFLANGRAECSERLPSLRPVEQDHLARCHFSDELTMTRSEHVSA